MKLFYIASVFLHEFNYLILISTNFHNILIWKLLGNGKKHEQKITCQVIKCDKCTQLNVLENKTRTNSSKVTFYNFALTGSFCKCKKIILI